MWTLVGQGEVMAYAEPKPVPEKDLDKLNADLEETDKATRVEAALALRIAGASYSEIADVLGYASVSSAPTRPPKSRCTPPPSVRWSAGSPSRRRRCSPDSPRMP